jgi:hypothetical protein
MREEELVRRELIALQELYQIETEGLPRWLLRERIEQMEWMLGKDFPLWSDKRKSKEVKR